MFVLDSSVTLTWCFREERTALSEVVLAELLEGGIAFVPSLWALEVSNVLVRSVRRKLISSAQADDFADPLLDLPIEVEATAETLALGEVRQLALRTQTSAYDAAFLELARRLDLPLATLDEPLRRAARRTGVDLVASR